VIAAAVVFVSVPEIFPLPLAAIPVTVPVLSLVHVYVTLAAGVALLDNTIGAIAKPEHLVWLAGVAMALGVGFIVMVNGDEVPGQVAPFV
jgi:hypothetical protein